MTSIIVAFFVSLSVATVLTPLVVRLANRRGLYDPLSDRKVHSRPVPRLGGIAIVLGFFAPLVGLLLVDAGITAQLTASSPRLVGLFVGGLLVAALGLFDDLRGANARQKFVVQIGVALLMWALDYRIDTVSNPFGGAIDLGPFALPVTVLWFVGVMNAVNLIDGLDGLAGGIGLISVSTLMALSLLDDNVVGALMCAGLAGSLVGFLFFNFNPARVFMGDTGSLFLGFVLATFSISTSSKGSTAIALTVPLLALALPIVDTMLAIGRRVRARKNIFQADQEHIHHKLLRAGFSHRGAVLTLYLVAALLAGLALVSRTASEPIAGLVLLAAADILFLFLRLLSGWRRTPRGAADPFGEHGLAARAALDTQAQRLHSAASPVALEAALTALAQATGCLSVVLVDGQRTLYVFDRPPTTHEAMCPLGSYELPLADRQGGARIELRFAREQQLETPSDLAVVLPWERVRPAITAVLERQGWPVLQEAIASAHAPPHTPTPVLDAAPAWSAPHPGAKGV